MEGHFFHDYSPPVTERRSSPNSATGFGGTSAVSGKTSSSEPLLPQVGSSLPEVPQTILSSNEFVPQTMLSSGLAVPQTMLSKPTVPHTMLSQSAPPQSRPHTMLSSVAVPHT